ncbi:Phage repressor protein C, contains Cro/C1-type HTH and peptisase s24 domains [Onishia taeanensis]|uniref:Phage repressor protein C, contains Cro/C1-type HTH and peptisase s24 domains n=1 Tax=Onishia taeanensis TaxID=284577 RepID=A0A1G7SWP0_9GAMM|nr:S24 family peptidase [Halomonas taeanensis]SDG27391.1 Phage repressor protein C, contains Cro/C1-type HTH and peptisase s24 domains [Halomonas taeanensis]
MSIMTVEEIPFRIREELTRLGLTMAAASRNAGESSGQRLKDVVAGRQKCPVELLARLESIGVDISYVITGSRPASGTAGAPAAYVVDDGAQVASALSDPGAGYSPVPMYDIEAAAGTGRAFDAENVETTLYFETNQLAAEGLDPVQLVGAKVRGDSMGETLRDGDQVLINRAQCKPDGVFLIRMGDELRIKRIQRVAGGALMLISDNTHYPPELLKPQDMKDVEILGRCEIRIGRIS